MELTTIAQTFVMHFGQMGSRWGINRTVGQIYALLFISPQPLNADQICETLGFSRSNVSMGLKELDGWQLLRVKHLPNDRRDHFTTPGDVWEIFRTLIEERRKREVEPTLTVLRDALLEQPANANDEFALERLREMHDLIEMLTDWQSEMRHMETKRLAELLKMGSRIYKLYEMKDKLRLIPGERKKS